MVKAIIWFLQEDTFKCGDQKSALIRESWLTALQFQKFERHDNLSTSVQHSVSKMHVKGHKKILYNKPIYTLFPVFLTIRNLPGQFQLCFLLTIFGYRGH